MYKWNTLLILSLLFLTSGNLSSQTIGTLVNTPEALDAYTLFSPTFGRNSYIIDNCGQVINHWTHDQRAGLAGKLLPDGRLLRTGTISHPLIQQTSQGGLIEIYNWDGSLDWSYDFSDEIRTQHHEIVYMNNGNILVLAWEYIVADSVLELGRNTDKFPLRSLFGEAVYEIKPIGSDSAEVIWEWHLKDHYVQDFDSDKLNYVSDIVDHPRKYDINYDGVSRWGNTDWTHCNALDYNEDLDQILINCRNGNEFWLIDHSTTSAQAATDTGGVHGLGGDFLYRWGCPEAYGKGTFDDTRLYGAHGVEWIPADRLYGSSIIAFNNGTERPGTNYSTVEVITPIIDSTGAYIMGASGVFQPTEAVYTFEDRVPEDFYSNYQSNAMFLPNGHLFTNRGDDGHLVEFDSTGKVVWEYWNPSGQNGPAEQGTYPRLGQIFIATRVPVDDPAFDGKDLTPMGLLELNGDTSLCQLFSAIEITTPSLEADVRYNPWSDEISVSNGSRDMLNIIIYSTRGAVIHNSKLRNGSTIINTFHWIPGLYMVSLLSDGGKSMTQSIVIH